MLFNAASADLSNNKKIYKNVSTQIEMANVYNYFNETCTSFLVHAKSEEHFATLICVWQSNFSNEKNVPYIVIAKNGSMDVKAVNNVGTIAFTVNAEITVVPLQ